MNINSNFVVIGGGVAGVCAAITAARNGLKTVLVHNRPFLGGPSGAECCADSDGRFITGASEYVNRSARETGLLEEMKCETFYRSANGWKQHWSLILREWCEREENLTLLMNTEAVEVKTDNNRILAVKAITQGNEKQYWLSAPVFADCSGDSFLGFNAGAEFRIGREASSEFNETLAPEKADKKTMGSSIAFRAVDTGSPVPFFAPDWIHKINSDDDLPYRLHNKLSNGYWWLEYGGECDTIGDNEEIYKKLLSVLYGVWDHVKNGDDHGAANYAINWISSIPAKRESRRLEGEVMLNQNDIVGHTEYPDAVAYGGWPIDIHPPEGVFGKGHPGSAPPFVFPGVYHIPFRALYSRNITNLMMAGRNISVSHVALGSTRVMATCGLCAQAVGTAAALCLKYSCDPADISTNHVEELQKMLHDSDVLLPYKEVPEESVFTQAEADSEESLEIRDITGELPLKAEDKERKIFDPCDVHPADRRRAQMFPLATGQISHVDIAFNNHSNNAKNIKAELYEASRPGIFEGRKIAESTAVVSPGKEQYGRFEFNINTAEKACFIVLSAEDEVSACISRRHLPGLYCKPDSTYFTNENFVFKVFPEQRIFSPSNVLFTPAHPGLKSNMWISDSTKDFPQKLKLSAPAPVSCSSVEIVFDTNLDKQQGYGAPAECVREYTLDLLTQDGKRILAAHEKNNRHRIKRHNFAEMKITGILLTIISTNGDASARVYNIRVK